MPTTTKSYDILIGGLLYKTITVTGGYNFGQIQQDIHNLSKVGQLSGFDLSKGIKVVPSTPTPVATPPVVHQNNGQHNGNGKDD